jgi:hypothetical protein
MPNSADLELLELFKRCAAAITSQIQPGVDLVVPIFFCNDQSTQVTVGMVSCVLVHVKNHKPGFRDANYLVTATSYLSAGCRHRDQQGLAIPVALHEPRAALGTSDLRHRLTAVQQGRRSESQNTVCLAVFTLSGEAYSVVHRSVGKLLGRIGRRWVDPLAAHEEDAEARAMLRSMLPCQYKAMKTALETNEDLDP